MSFTKPAPQIVASMLKTKISSTLDFLVSLVFQAFLFIYQTLIVHKFSHHQFSIQFKWNWSPPNHKPKSTPQKVHSQPQSWFLDKEFSILQSYSSFRVQNHNSPRNPREISFTCPARIRQHHLLVAVDHRYCIYWWFLLHLTSGNLNHTRSEKLKLPHHHICTFALSWGKCLLHVSMLQTFFYHKPFHETCNNFCSLAQTSRQVIFKTGFNSFWVNQLFPAPKKTISTRHQTDFENLQLAPASFSFWTN